MEKINYVYCTTNLINSRKYIGSHTGKIHDNYLGSGVNLTKALKKYGKENFIKEILWVGPKEYMREMETYWCEYFNVGENPLFYNCTSKGTGYEHGRPNIKLREYLKNNKREGFFKGKSKENNDSLKNISEKLKGKPSGMLGKSTWNKGLTGLGGFKFSEESKKNLYWERKKEKCEHCGRMIGINNMKVHFRKNHQNGKIVDSEIGDKIRKKLQKFNYVAFHDQERIEAYSIRDLSKKLEIDRGTLISKIKSGKMTKSGYKIIKEEIKKPS